MVIKIFVEGKKSTRKLVGMCDVDGCSSDLINEFADSGLAEKYIGIYNKVYHDFRQLDFIRSYSFQRIVEHDDDFDKVVGIEVTYHTCSTLIQ